MSQSKGNGSSPHDILEQTGFLYGANAPFIEQLYVKYVEDPSSVNPEWQKFFSDL